MKNFIITSSHYPNPQYHDLVKYWRDDIEKIYQLWISVYTDNKFYQDVLRGIQHSHKEEISDFHLVHTSYNYFIKFICVEIRRSVDADRRTISLLGILNSMYVHNQLLTIEKGMEAINKPEYDYFIDQYKGIWRDFGDSSLNCLDKKKIIKRISQLKKATKPVKDFVDKGVVHFEREGKQELTYKQIWDSANHIKELIDDLKLLLDFSAGSYDSIPQFDLYGHLYKPFWSADYLPERDEVEKFKHPGKENA